MAICRLFSYVQSFCATLSRIPVSILHSSFCFCVMSDGNVIVIIIALTCICCFFCKLVALILVWRSSGEDLMKQAVQKDFCCNFIAGKDRKGDFYCSFLTLRSRLVNNHFDCLWQIRISFGKPGKEALADWRTVGSCLLMPKQQHC